MCRGKALRRHAEAGRHTTQMEAVASSQDEKKVEADASSHNMLMEADASSQGSKVEAVASSHDNGGGCRLLTQSLNQFSIA